MIFFWEFLVSQDLIQKATELKLRLHMQHQKQQRSFNESNFIEKRQMYEDRMQKFNSEGNHPNVNPPAAPLSQRGSFQTSKSIDAESSYVHGPSFSTKPYESMTNLTQKTASTTAISTTNSGLKEKTLSRPRIPIIRDKSAPNAPYLNPQLTRRTTSNAQARVDLEKAKLKSFEERYKKSMRKRGKMIVV